MAGGIHLHQRFDDSPAALQGQSASLAVRRKLAFLDGGMPIADAAKIADLRPQSVGRIAIAWVAGTVSLTFGPSIVVFASVASVES